MTKNKPSISKYRPSLSPLLIEKILELAKKELPLSAESIQLISILAPFQAKIQNDGLIPAYSSAPKLTVEESIGMVESAHSRPYQSKEEFWLSCYNLYIEHPEKCTLIEIQAAREHMYLHELMTDTEMKEFEQESI